MKFCTKLLFIFQLVMLHSIDEKLYSSGDIFIWMEKDFHILTLPGS